MLKAKHTLQCKSPSSKAVFIYAIESSFIYTAYFYILDILHAETDTDMRMTKTRCLSRPFRLRTFDANYLLHTLLLEIIEILCIKKSTPTLFLTGRIGTNEICEAIALSCEAIASVKTILAEEL